MERTFHINTGTRYQDFTLPEENILYVTGDAAAERISGSTAPDEDTLIREAIAHPIGGVSLKDIPEHAHVVILVDDATRPTPAARILPHLMKEIEERTEDILFVTAPGTHRPMTEAELAAKIGPAYLAKYPVVNTDATREEDYEYIGETERMHTPLYIHKAVLAAEFLIAIGNIGPHNVVGWSGGAKIIQPGVSGRLTTERTHYDGSYERLENIFGNIECAERQEIDAIGEKVGLNYIANTVLDENGRILGLFCGHYRAAHRAGVAFAEQHLRPEIPALADLVIVSAYPSTADYWQGFKPVGFSIMGVRKGGIIIYLFDPKEGLCGNSPFHKPMLEKYLPKDEETVRAEVASGKVTDIVGICNPLCHYQILEKASVYCVTNSLTKEECDLLRFKRYERIEDAIRDAFEVLGEDAKVGVIPCGGETLVRVKKNLAAEGGVPGGQSNRAEQY